MSQKGVEQLIGKALADKGFLDSLLANPEGAIRSSGLDISAEELGQIKAVDKAKAMKLAETFAQEFAGRKQPAA